LGAQQAASGGASAGTLTPKDGGTAFITDSTTSNAVQPLLRNANPPGVATDGAGNPVPVDTTGQESVANENPTSSTDPSNQQIATDDGG
jgi:hypothetical protein